MKVCSFLPAVTHMIYDMGLDSYLKGVTFECPPFALKEKDRVVLCVLEGRTLTSQEIDVIFSESKAKGESLYYVDQPILENIQPDLVFTQDVCEVCQIDTECTEKAISTLAKRPELLPISPDSLDDVFDSIETIAGAIGYPEKGKAHRKALDERIDAIVDVQRANRLRPKKISLLEWVDPIYNCGHWIPDQIALAGGIDLLSHPSGDSIVTPWEKILRYDPEVIVIAPCGYHIDTTIAELNILEEKAGWKDLTAVKNKQVYVADFDMFTQPSASTLVDGIEVLSHLFHPDYCKVSSHLQQKFKKVYA